MGKKLTTEQFIDKAVTIHGNMYDYSEVSYTNSQSKITVICLIHGRFYPAPNDHLKGTGCPICGRIRGGKKNTENTINSRPNLSCIIVPKNAIAIPVGKKGGYALVDKEDYELVYKYSWQFIKHGYVHNSKIGLMHRLIMKPPKNKRVDHINHMVFDNRKSNLRVCDQKDNVKNRISDENRFSSKYKGVSWYKNRGLWLSRITYDGKRICLGYFYDEIKAAKAYDEAAKKYHKEFAYLNFR